MKSRPKSWWTAPELVLWALFILAIPFYVGQSGLPQPGNVLIFLLLPTALARWNRRLPPRMRVPFMLLVAFTVWVTVVDLGWALITNNWALGDYVVYPTYYLYNAAVMLVALVLYQRHGELFLKLTVNVLALLVGFQVAISFALAGGGMRGSMFFNNPNQLGYYALLVACLVTMLQPYVKMSIVRTALILLGCAYLAFISASRAAVGGIAILSLLLTVTNRRVLVVSIGVIVATAFIGGPFSHVMDATQERIEYRKHENLIESRGYDRLWRYPEYLPLGAGEGDFDRFAEPRIGSREIHSSAATVLFSYGLIGAGIFLAFAYRVIAGASLRNILLVTPILAYTITHQGLRFTMLWILLALFLAIKPEKKLRRRSLAAPQPYPAPVSSP